jgi:hypothetical protein
VIPPVKGMAKRKSAVPSQPRPELGGCNIGDAGAEALAGALAEGRIGTLALWHNPLSEAQRQQMTARFGDRVDFGYSWS